MLLRRSLVAINEHQSHKHTSLPLVAAPERSEGWLGFAIKAEKHNLQIVTNTLVTICWLIKKTLMDVKCKRMLSFSSQDQNCWLISNQGLPGSRTSPKIFCEVHSSPFLPSIKCSFSGKGFPSVCYKAGLTNL